MEPYIFAFGCGVSFMVLAGMYVWFRHGFTSDGESTEDRRERGVVLANAESSRA